MYCSFLMTLSMYLSAYLCFCIALHVLGVNEGCVVVQKLMRLIEMIPELRPGFNLQASIAEMLQAERTESSNLRRFFLLCTLLHCISPVLFCWF